jgi:hypothetical protein
MIQFIIHYGIIWNKYKNLEYLLFITVLSIKDPKIGMSNWLLHPIHLGNLQVCCLEYLTL